MVETNAERKNHNSIFKINITIDFWRMFCPKRISNTLREINIDLWLTRANLAFINGELLPLSA